MVAPVADQVPLDRLVAVMVEAVDRRHEHGQRVMFVVRAQEGGAQCALAVDDMVGLAEADDVGIEAHEAAGIAAGKDDMLQPGGKAIGRRRDRAGHAEYHDVPVGVARRHRVVLEHRRHRQRGIRPGRGDTRPQRRQHGPVLDPIGRPGEGPGLARPQHQATLAAAADPGTVHRRHRHAEGVAIEGGERRRVGGTQGQMMQPTAKGGNHSCLAIFS